MRFTFNLTILLLIPLIAAAQNSKHGDGLPIFIDDWKKEISSDVSQTFWDLLSQSYPKVEVKSRGLTIVFREYFEESVVDSGQAMWFISQGTEHLALIVHLRNPLPIRSGNIFSSDLLVFRLAGSHLKLLDKIGMEFDQPQKPTADFYNEAALVPIRRGKIADYAFTVFTTKRDYSEHKIVQKFRLYGITKNRLKVFLDDLPPLVTTNKCGETDYENEQILREIKTAEQKNGRNRLELMILGFSAITPDCRTYRENRIEKINIYEAVWNRRRGRYRTRLKSVETVISQIRNKN